MHLHGTRGHSGSRRSHRSWGCDVIGMLRLQNERMNGALLPSAQEFFKTTPPEKAGPGGDYGETDRRAREQAGFGGALSQAGANLPESAAIRAADGMLVAIDEMPAGHNRLRTERVIREATDDDRAALRVLALVVGG